MTDRLEEIRKNLDVWGASGTDEAWLIAEVEKLRERAELLLNDWREEKARRERAVDELRETRNALGKVMQSLETTESLLAEERASASAEAQIDQIGKAVEEQRRETVLAQARYEKASEERERFRRERDEARAELEEVSRGKS